MSDLTHQILVEIRDELRGTNERLDGTNQRVDGTNQRLDRLEQRHVHSEVRIATELAAVQATLGDVVSLLRDNRVARRTLDDHEARLRALEDQKRTG